MVKEKRECSPLEVLSHFQQQEVWLCPGGILDWTTFLIPAKSSTNNANLCLINQQFLYCWLPLNQKCKYYNLWDSYKRMQHVFLKEQWYLLEDFGISLK